MNNHLGLRLKLLIPLFFLAGTFALSLQLYWLPSYLEKGKTKFLTRQANAMALLSESLASPIHSADVAQIYNTLDRVLLSQPLWIGLSLDDIKGNRIYPFEQPSPLDHPHVHTMVHNVVYYDKPRAQLTLVVDLAPVQQDLLNEAHNLLIMIIFILLISIVVGIATQERLIRRPIIALANTASELAKGKFDTRLPRAGGDEIGNLIDSFEHMRAKIFSYHEELRQAIDKADAGNRAKSQFLANMSHEIRTPLTAIIGYAETLLDDNQHPADRTNATRVVIENGKHLLQIINEILDLSKIEAKKLDIETMNVSLFTILRDVESIIGLQAGEKGLAFHINYHYPLPFQIQTDAIRVKQILINLCSNAIKFTERGSVTLDVRYLCDCSHIEVSITDSGIGMSEEHLDRIFTAFSQADASTTRKYGGTGLGLSLSKHLAAMLGGDLRASSVLHQGSCFVLTIATGTIDTLAHGDADVRDQRQPKDPPASNRLLCGRVLLAEDTITLQKLVAMYLKKAGVEVHCVDNGREALEAARAGLRCHCHGFTNAGHGRADSHEADTAIRLYQTHYCLDRQCI